MDVAGTGRYPNPRGALLDLPGSGAFAFEGDPWTGLTVRSPRNDLVLEAEPLVERPRRIDGTTVYAMTSAGRRSPGVAGRSPGGSRTSTSSAGTATS